MATESVTEPTDNEVLSFSSAKTFLEDEWERSGLPMAISNRMRHMDEKVHALSGIRKLLHADRQNIETLRGFHGYTYEPIPVHIVEDLEIAEKVLLDGLIGEMEQMRSLVKKHGTRVLR